MPLKSSDDLPLKMGDRMTTDKKLNINVNTTRDIGFRQRINSNPQLMKAEAPRKTRLEQLEFEAIVMEQIYTLKRQAEILGSDAVWNFFKLLRVQLSKKNPNPDDILKLIENTKV
jgi:hypothetical protein